MGYMKIKGKLTKWKSNQYSKCSNVDNFYLKRGKTNKKDNCEIYISMTSKKYQQLQHRNLCYANGRKGS